MAKRRRSVEAGVPYQSRQDFRKCVLDDIVGFACQQAHNERLLGAFSGRRGATGSRGASGRRGAIGSRGASGARGAFGSRGASGGRGAIGSRVASGRQGAIGSRSAQ